MSQPAASMRLRSLEGALGLTLLDRSSGRATLTRAGLAVVQWGDEVIDAMQNLMLGVNAARSEGKRHLRIVSSMTVAEYLIPTWLNRFQISNPETSVALTMANSEQVSHVMTEHGADIGFVEGQRAPAGLESKIILKDTLVIVVAPSHPWARRRSPVSAKDLGGVSLVLRESGSGTREVLEAALKQHGHTPTPLIELASTTAIKAAVASGIGPGILSTLAVKSDVRDGLLVEVASAGIALDRSIRAVWPYDQPLGSAARLFLRQASETQ
jgi:DNA-binding transcriptional LysR family regulator